MKAINSESLGQWRQNAPSDIGDEKGVDIGKSEKTAVDRIGKGGLLASFIERWALWIQICAMVAACLCLAPVDTFADEIDDDLAGRRKACPHKWASDSLRRLTASNWV